jgi:hypothetical protein
MRRRGHTDARLHELLLKLFQPPIPTPAPVASAAPVTLTLLVLQARPAANLYA